VPEPTTATTTGEVSNEISLKEEEPQEVWDLKKIHRMTPTAGGFQWTKMSLECARQSVCPVLIIRSRTRINCIAEAQFLVGNDRE
jgi:hypothetical protein